MKKFLRLEIEEENFSSLVRWNLKKKKIIRSIFYSKNS